MNNYRRLTAISLLGAGPLFAACSTDDAGATDPGADGQPMVIHGKDGVDGMDGAPGEGTNGKDGKDGEDGEDGADAPPAAPDIIELPGERFFPEGVAIDGAGALYVGSIPTGEILKADLRTGDASLFSEAPRSAMGMLADGDVLLVCDVGLTTDWAEPSAVLVLDLADGSEIARHTFPEGALFCNDLTVDGAGNVYATESFGNAIYKIAAEDRLTDGALTLFSDSDLFSVGMVQGNFGLNGIAWDEDATLYVANFFTGSLFSVEIMESGEAGTIAVVDLEDGQGPRSLKGPDGMKWGGPEQLMVAEQGSNWLSRINLKTKEILPVAGGFDVPSTFALDKTADAWVVNSQLDDFMGGTAPKLPFTVEWAPLD